MKFEAGKYYKTRVGQKAFVAATENPFCPSFYPIIGYISDSTSVAKWTPGGGFFNSFTQSPYDLISEWKEPVTVTKWLLLWSDGTTSLSCTIPLLPVSHLVAFKQVTITEGEGM